MRERNSVLSRAAARGSSCRGGRAVAARKEDVDGDSRGRNGNHRPCTRKMADWDSRGMPCRRQVK